ncbi:MAG: CoA transferase [Chloroflexi bacterium]|nr:CoA transferase [Chloroflexota bacterium]
MLSPYTVLDLTDDKGELAGMMLGDLGANVIKVEPPQGSSSRRMGPFLEDAPEPERSLQYFAFNRNKRGITLDLSAEAGRRALIALAEKADFVIESAPPGRMAGLGVGFDTLRQANPRIVYVAITAYGQDGPHADFPASDLTLAAMGGPMSLQGVPDRAPVRLSVPQVWLHASAEAVVGALTAHALMIRTGEAQFVDVSAQTAMVWTMLQGMVAHAIQGFDFNRGGSTIQLGSVTVRLVHECADGYVVIFPIGGALAKLVQWCVQDGLVTEDWIDAEDWPTYHFKVLQGQPVSHSLDEVLDAVGRYVRHKSKSTLLEQSIREGVTMAPVSTIEELARFRQLEERGYWLAAPLPDGQEVLVPGIFARLSEAPMSVRRWPPTLGEHNQEVLGGMLGLSIQEIATAAGSV